jgi:hypothetical protein
MLMSQCSECPLSVSVGYWQHCTVDWHTYRYASGNAAIQSLLLLVTCPKNKRERESTSKYACIVNNYLRNWPNNYSSNTNGWIKSKSTIRSIPTHHRQNPTEITNGQWLFLFITILHQEERQFSGIFLDNLYL